MARPIFIFALLLSAVLFVTGCKQADDPPSGPDDGNEIPAGMARISGTVFDADGNPLPNALLHVVYEFSGGIRSGGALDNPSLTSFANDVRLYTQCGGTTPLPDGVVLKIFWDRNGDGVDPTDPQPPLCANPPDCDSGPALTVNFNEFRMNGAALGGPEWTGYFSTERYFVTVGDVLSPNRFYVRIYCADGNVLYTSQVVDVPPGPSETVLTFTCTPCDGTPEVPVWALDVPYPNPARDSLTVRYGLEQAATAALTLWSYSGQQLANWLSEQRGAGPGRLVRGLSDLPNGLYEVRMNAGSYANRRSFLKNETDYNILRGMEPIAGSSDAGEFTFLTGAGVTIERRGDEGENLGTAELNRISVAAVRVGYQTADTSFAVAAGQQYNVNLTLRPQ